MRWSIKQLIHFSSHLYHPILVCGDVMQLIYAIHLLKCSSFLFLWAPCSASLTRPPAPTQGNASHCTLTITHCMFILLEDQICYGAVYLYFYLIVFIVSSNIPLYFPCIFNVYLVLCITTAVRVEGKGRNFNV